MTKLMRTALLVRTTLVAGFTATIILGGQARPANAQVTRPANAQVTRPANAQVTSRRLRPFVTGIIPEVGSRRQVGGVLTDARRPS